MKAKQIRRARIEILSKGYYFKRLEFFANKCHDWHVFLRFDCDEFFRGRELCEFNKMIYKKEAPRASAEYKWYKKKLNIK